MLVGEYRMTDYSTRLNSTQVARLCCAVMCCTHKAINCSTKSEPAAINFAQLSYLSPRRQYPEQRIRHFLSTAPTAGLIPPPTYGI